MEFSAPLVKPLDSVFNIGAASGTPVDDKDYQVLFKFEGTIKRLTYTLDRPELCRRTKRSSSRRSATTRRPSSGIGRLLPLERSARYGRGRLAYPSLG